MSILNVNTIQPVGSGQTITVSATNISAPSTVVTASSFVGNVSGGSLSGINTLGVTTAYITQLAGVGAGTSIQIPSGSKLIGATTGSIVAPGTLLQVSTGTRSAYLSITSSSYTDANLSASITPQYTTSRILVSVSVPAAVYSSAAVGYGNQTNGGFQIVRQVPGTDTNVYTEHSDGGGKYAFGLVAASYSTATNLNMWNRWTCVISDFPSTVGIVTYKLQAAKGTSGMGSIDLYQGTGGIITLMEIAQ